MSAAPRARGWFCEGGTRRFLIEIKCRRYYEKAPKRQLTVKPEGVTVGCVEIIRTNQRKGANMIYLGMDISSKSFVVHGIDEREAGVGKRGDRADPCGT